MKKLSLALALCGAALSAPAIAGPTVISCTSPAVPNVIACNLVAGNALNNSDNAALSADIAALGNGASFTSTFTSLPAGNSVSALTGVNTTTNLGSLSFGQTLFGNTIVGIHYGNGGDQSTIFYLFNFTTPVTSISGIEAQSFSTATLFSTTVGSVPEPATWAMMLLGFGAIGFAMRRRRRSILPQLA